MKIISLIKASFSEGMNLFKYKTKANSKKITKILFPVILAIIVMFAVGSYAYMFASPLHEVNLTYVVLSLFIMIVTITTFIEGMYKSQGILFDSSDNDLLFSLPIKKSTILFLRLFKLLTFEFLYNLLFLLPAFIVYIYFENPSINFYFISIIYLILIPIIPTILSSLIGYVIKLISSKFKAKKIIQTILTTIIMLGIFALSFNLEGLTTKIAENATSINDILTKIYYPIGAYNELIESFNILTFIKVLLLNIIPFIIFVYLGSIYYFKIISKTNESGRTSTSKSKIKVRSKLNTLIKKELTRFFSSPVYMFNTSFGIFIMVMVVILLAINQNALINMVINNFSDFNITKDMINEMLPTIFIELIIFTGCMTSITSSSISLEGSSIDLTKSMPISEKTIFLSKIIASDIISLPLMLLSDLIFIFRFTPSINNIILILLFTIIVPTFTAIIGLIINLKYPKLKFTNDTEVVKQSMSTMIAVFIGMGVFAITLFLMIKFFDFVSMLLIIEIILFTIITYILWLILNSFGKRKWQKLN